MSNIIQAIRKELVHNADEKTQAGRQIFFREQVILHGVRTSIVSKIAKAYYNEIKEMNKEEIFNLCEVLWKSGYLEETFIACNWSYFIRDDYEPADFQVFERWVHMYVTNWASCDTLCNHTIGSFLELYPAFIANLKHWAQSPNRWMRRASAVSLIIPARKGKFLEDIFTLADILLLDDDDLVQKGYGWMLKSTSEAYQKEVFEYVINNKTKMPRTALRYAIEKMPKYLKDQAMERVNQ
jgi:3-methyladenine DNA glycosylase AlkD